MKKPKERRCPPEVEFLFSRGCGKIRQGRGWRRCTIGGLNYSIILIEAIFIPSTGYPAQAGTTGLR